MTATTSITSTRDIQGGYGELGALPFSSQRPKETALKEICFKIGEFDDVEAQSSESIQARIDELLIRMRKREANLDDLYTKIKHCLDRLQLLAQPDSQPSSATPTHPTPVAAPAAMAMAAEAEAKSAK